MMRSMFSAISGLKSFQTSMDVVGSNIANVNTPGYKASRVVFQTALSQLLKSARTPSEGLGGINPIQIGLGSRIAAIDKMMTQGSFQSTGKKTDLAIQGDGFFIVTDGVRKYYTRAGNFDLDSNGNLIQTSTGLKVMGWQAQLDPTTGRRFVDTNLPVSELVVKAGMTLPAKKTTVTKFGGNMKSDVGFKNFEITLTADDGTKHNVRVTFSRSGEISDDSNDPFNENQRYTFEVDTDGDGTAETSGYVVLDKFGNVVDAAFSGGGTSYSVASGADLVITNSGTFKFYEADDPTNFVIPDYQSPLFTTSAQVYDTLGNPYQVYFDFIKLGYVDDDHRNVWIWRARIPTGEEISYMKDDTTDVANAIGGVINFDETGMLKDFGGLVDDGDSTTPITVENSISWNPDDQVKYIKFDAGRSGDSVVKIKVDLNELTQYSGEFSAAVDYQDGYPLGTLESFAINEYGEIVGTFSNGITDALGKVALAVFNNPAGLTDMGKSLYIESANSGIAKIGEVGSGGRGTLIPGALEMSNVDLAEEFTKMIVSQRGFQANARVITTSDQILNELVNIKR
ncbi:MAG: flagellar hook protein FlgE [Thermotogaceae bacterium]|nr:flagellar hook protein FlgE [Thermotogaceae bacterium]